MTYVLLGLGYITQCISLLHPFAWNFRKPTMLYTVSHMFTTLSPGGGHLGYLHDLGVVDRSAMNTGEHVSLE